MTQLKFAVFTRFCEPYVKVRYTDYEIYEPDNAVIMVDIGLKTASENGGAVSMDYIKYVMRYSRKYVTLFVIPDVWHYEQHINNANQFIQLAGRLRNVDNMVPILIGHYFYYHTNEYLELLNELSEIFPVTLLGVPGNMVTATRPFKCVRKQTVCNQYILSVLNVAKKWGFKVHILGVARKTLDFIVRNNIDGVISVDSDKTSVRFPHRREYCVRFREWLQPYEQPPLDEWLFELVT
jgi:hypothetical protein